MRVADSNTEYFDAEMRAPLLKRIATETGGKFYTPATASTLAEDVALSKRGVTVVNQMDLWDMPVMFLLLVAARERGVGVPKVAGAGMSGGGRLDGWTGGRRVRRGSAWLDARRCPVARRSRAQTHLVIVSGLGGETKYATAFANLSQTLADAANKRFGIPDAEIVWLGEDSVVEEAALRGQSTKVNVERAIAPAGVARRCGRSDRARAHRPRQRRRARTRRSAFPGPT